MALHTFGGSALLAAIYTRLTTHALTSAYKTYGYVPTSATFPYVSIGGLIGGKSAGFTSQDIKGQDLVCHLNLWSSYQGDKEVSDMMENCVQAITGTDLTISGYTTLIGIADFEQVMIDETVPGQLLRHGVIRLRFQIA